MKNLVFDLGGVCLSNYWGWQQKELLSKEFGLDPVRTKEYGKERSMELNSGKISEREFFRGLFESQNSVNKTDEAINFLREQCFVDEDVLNLVKILKERYRTFALTNEIKEAAEFRAKKFNLEDYFEEIFVSGVIGHVKPMKSAYEYVVREIGSRVDDIIYIDNSFKNLVPANELGIATIYFKDFNGLRSDLEEKGIIA